MSTLTSNRVREITEAVATANSVSFASVVTSPTIDSTGAEAIEIKIVLTPGSSDAIMGEPSANTVVQVIQQLADAGEDRALIVRYEEQVAAPGPRASIPASK
jgi:hypothetical protein